MPTPPNHRPDTLTTSTGPDLIPIAEKELLGYDQPSETNFPARQKLALRHQDEIFAAVKPQVEKALGREVDLIELDATYPTQTITVTYRTVDEPIIADAADIAIDADGAPVAGARVYMDEQTELRTVQSLLRIAYRTELDQLRDTLLATYPEFTVLPERYVAAHQMADPVFTVNFNSGPWEKAEADAAAEDALYAAYLEQPKRTDAEWRAIFDQAAGGRKFQVSVHLVLADPDHDIEESVSVRIAEDVKNATLPLDFNGWAIFTHTNLVLREKNGFHRQFDISYHLDDGDVGWDVNEWRDGGTL